VAVTVGWPCWVGVVAKDLDAQRRFYRDTLELAGGEAVSEHREARWQARSAGGGK
jgi:hypothetical protein